MPPTPLSALATRACAAALATGAFIAPSFAADKPATPSMRPNVLMIAVDDLNHWVGHLGRNVQTQTPAMDALAARGVSFVHAYCPAPLCNPSRAAILSGRRPYKTGVYENTQDWRILLPKEQTMPGVFAAAGYRTAGAGKIYDYKYPRPEDFDIYATRAEIGGYPEPAPDCVRSFGEVTFAPLEADDNEMPEYKMVDFALKQLEAQAKAGKNAQPLFLAVGFFRPHAPWFVPRKYYDMHPLADICKPPHKEDDLEDVPPPARKMAGANSRFKAIADTGNWERAIQGYLAAVSFSDAMVGRLLEGIDRHPALRENTIIVLWGDNGWHLGEKNHFGKYTLWEESTRVPYVWVVPQLTPQGKACQRAVDLMSMYPTLLALCGIPKPDYVDGQNIEPLLKNPLAPWDKGALSTYKPNNHSVRIEQWRYTRYADGSEELYNEAKDPYEWENLAGKPEYEAVKADLRAAMPEACAPAQPVSQAYTELRRKEAERAKRQAPVTR